MFQFPRWTESMSGLSACAKTSPCLLAGSYQVGDTLSAQVCWSWLRRVGSRESSTAKPVQEHLSPLRRKQDRDQSHPPANKAPLCTPALSRLCLTCGPKAGSPGPPAPSLLPRLQMHPTGSGWEQTAASAGGQHIEKPTKYGVSFVGG